ncbi:MAG: hypothetical protein Salg2KO_21440 [Salibacteraceae bacterium]
MNLAIKAFILITLSMINQTDLSHVDEYPLISEASANSEGVVERRHHSQREQMIITSQLSEMEVSAAAQSITNTGRSMIILRQTGDLPPQDINVYSAMIEKFSELYIDSNLISIPDQWEPSSETASLMLRDIANKDISLSLKCCSLKSLYIWSKGIDEIGISGNLGSLESIHLSGGLTRIDADWENAKSLRNIAIGNAHRFENLPDDIFAGGSVSHFIVLNSPVKKLPDLTHSINSLESMTIENTSISFFAKTLAEIDFHGGVSISIPDNIDVMVDPYICESSFKWTSIRFVNFCK